MDYSQLSDAELDKLIADKMQSSQPSWLENQVGGFKRGVEKLASVPGELIGLPSKLPYIGQYLDIGKAANDVGNLAYQHGVKPALQAVGMGGDQNTTLSQIAPGMFDETGQGYKFQRGGHMDFSPADLWKTGISTAVNPANYMFPEAVKTAIQPLGAIAKGVGNKLVSPESRAVYRENPSAVTSSTVPLEQSIPRPEPLAEPEVTPEQSARVREIQNKAPQVIDTIHSDIGSNIVKQIVDSGVKKVDIEPTIDNWDNMIASE